MDAKKKIELTTTAVNITIVVILLISVYMLTTQLINANPVNLKEQLEVREANCYKCIAANNLTNVSFSDNANKTPFLKKCCPDCIDPWTETT